MLFGHNSIADRWKSGCLLYYRPGDHFKGNSELRNSILVFHTSCQIWIVFICTLMMNSCSKSIKVLASNNKNERNTWCSMIVLALPLTSYTPVNPASTSQVSYGHYSFRLVYRIYKVRKEEPAFQTSFCLWCLPLNLHYFTKGTALEMFCFV
jgi:hypothetical protein